MAQQGYPGASGPYGYPQQQPGGPPAGKTADRAPNWRAIHFCQPVAVKRTPGPLLQALDQWLQAGISRSSRA